MMDSSTGKPTGDGPRFEPPVAGPLPVQRDATETALGHTPHDRPARRSEEGETLHRPPLLAGDRRPHLSEPDREQPAGQPGPGWDLCDDAIQQLFAIGIAMSITQRRCNDHPELAARIADHMKDLQGIVEKLRSTMQEPGSLPAQLVLT